MNYYKLIYGNGTHNLRVFTLLISSVWGVLVVLSLSGSIELHLPDNPLVNFHLLGVMLVVTSCITGLSFFVKGVEGVMLRFFSLTTGALSQALLALRFSSVYPPLDVMSLMCTVTSLWLLGGAFYVNADVKRD